jgi:hypothetical protein
MTTRLLKPRRNRAAELALKEVDASNRAGIVECLEAGLPTITARYGHHSYEARSVEQMLKKLKKNR